MSPDHDSIRRWLPVSWVAVALLLGVLVLGACFQITHRAALADLKAAQENDMRARMQALESVLLRQRAVTTVLADDGLVRRALLEPDQTNRDRVSRKLDGLREQTDSAVIYLLDRNGVAIAASNWDEKVSFVGQDYSFRDYFSEAMQNAEATQFALGTISNRAGLYLSHSVAPDDGGASALGVMVVKVEFDGLERNWANAKARTDVVDANGQIILSSDPARRFVPASAADNMAVTASTDVPGTDWVMTVTGSARPALYAALFATGTAGFGLTLLAVLGGFALRARHRTISRMQAERRYRADLQHAVDERTRALSDEIRERQVVEQRLDRLQAEMVQANKLAALGQITAGVAHEVNQPLATIRLLAENGEALLSTGATSDVADNLSSIRRMTERISRITDQLRGFARKAKGELGAVPLSDAFDAALLLTTRGQGTQHVRIELPPIPSDLRVVAETVRLEQILVNLLQNAQEALAETPDARITVTVEAGRMVRIVVSDNGPGLPEEIAAQLFTPFLTSKPSGMGLGLVISQDIARECGGSLRAAPSRPGQGASFILDLPRAE
ncbi:sensor histidine kinase [Paracoccus aestuariivivens]|uniref:sensor histidine kinase n=1 Tax=Paracoccus aestuariivivens TaxID=1820333 RepID=UPI0031B61EF5